MKKENNNINEDRLVEKKTKINKSTAVKLKKLKDLEDLEGKFLLVKVGTPEQPASDEQISDIQNKLIDLFEKNNINCVAFVTHHAVSMEIIDSTELSNTGEGNAKKSDF